MSALAHVVEDFPLLQRAFDGRRIAYLDSAATTQKPQAVIDAISDYYQRSNANVHRGAYRLAGEATDAYEGARAKAAEFIKAGSASEVVFTRGTTSSINAIGGRFSRSPRYDYFPLDEQHPAYVEDPYSVFMTRVLA